MEHKGTQRIETSRLILRPFAIEDRESMYDNWASDPEVTRYLTWPTHTSPEVTEEILREWAAQYINMDFYQWAIELKRVGVPVGSISVVHYESRIRAAVVGYCIGRKWWRQGITSEALQAVIDFLIGEVGFNRVESYHDSNNPNSGAVMRKCGMTYEGTLKQSDWNNQGIVDKCCYAVLAEEWRFKRGIAGGTAATVNF